MKRLKVIFIDTGINENHPAFEGQEFDGFSLNDNGYIEKSCKDEIGHGTSVVFNFIKNYSKAHCVMFKVFKNKTSIKEDKLIMALEYIDKNLRCDIINISCGLSMCSQVNKLNSICEKLVKKGTIIISAFDNNGSISYPACLPCVIGVDISTSCLHQNDYQFVNSNLINIRGYGYSYKLPTLESSYVVCAGSSFVCSYISSIVAYYLEQGNTGLEQILNCLKEQANVVYSPILAKELKLDYCVGKSIIFPFNKEMHALVAFSSLLKMNLVGVYDLNYNLKVGKCVSSVINKTYYLKEDYVIQDINKINWDSFDTIIIGHLSKIEIALQTNIKQPLIKSALKHKKNIYLYDLDGLDENTIKEINNNPNCFVPEITEEYVSQNQFGKLYQIAKPVVGFFGTSPKQGKLTTQMLCKNYFNSLNYSVGVLGTEPNSLLLDFDEIYSMGFNSTVKISGGFAIQYINQLLHKIELKNPDIIFVGSQSQTICMNTGNLGFYPTSQYELLLGTQPDAIVLNINIMDSLDYVLRTIKFLESTINTKVLAIVVFPIQYDNYQGHLIGKGKYYSDESITEFMQRVKEITNKPTYLLDEKAGKKVGNTLIDYF